MWEGQEPAQVLQGFVALDSGPSRPAFAERGHMWEGPGLVPVTCVHLEGGDVSIHRSSPEVGGCGPASSTPCGPAFTQGWEPLWGRTWASRCQLGPVGWVRACEEQVPRMS